MIFSKIYITVRDKKKVATLFFSQLLNSLCIET